MKTDLFQSCGHCWVFHICWHIECSTFTALCFRIRNSSTGIPSSPLALFIVMLSKAHLTSHSRMSGYRWVITPSWLSGSWRSFLYSSSVYSCHLFLIFSASVSSLPFLSFIEHIFVKGNQPWILIQRTDVEAETPVFWSFELNSWLFGKFSESDEDWWQKEKRALEAGWTHWCNRHELGQTLGDDEGQRGLPCCILWVAKSQTPLGDWTTTIIFDLTFSNQSIRSVVKK